MKNIQRSIESFPSVSDRDAAAVVGGAAFPVPEIWRRVLVTVLEIVLEAALTELRRAFHLGRRTVDPGPSEVGLQG